MKRSTEDVKLTALSRSPLFAGFSKKELELLGRITDELDLPEGRVLMREGENGREFYVIIEGEADVVKGGNHIRTCGPGEFVGEISLIAQTPRTATVTAKSPMRVFVMADHAFRGLLSTNRDVETKVLRSMAAHLLATSPAAS
jgi:CRP/FNR family cyclic AMP-dependent transcriptional regulator